MYQEWQLVERIPPPSPNSPLKFLSCCNQIAHTHRYGIVPGFLFAVLPGKTENVEKCNNIIIICRLKILKATADLNHYIISLFTCSGYTLTLSITRKERQTNFLMQDTSANVYSNVWNIATDAVQWKLSQARLAKHSHP